MAFSAFDHAMMARALRLAARGAYTTRPNPMVGCVLTQDAGVVGEGAHLRRGEPHAETFALREAGGRAFGATAYVTLEPCAHTGSTPPCADALIAAGVSRVVVASSDPFKRVDGEGLRKLEAAGIAVEVGLMQAQARVLNRGFFSRIERGRPWLRIKLGMSLDGRTALANGDSKWITSPASRADVQSWRARSGALLTASGTVLVDNPRLTVRVDELGGVREVVPPLRVVLDPGLAIPESARILDSEAPTLLIHASDARIPQYLRAHDRVAVASARGMLDLAEVLRVLGEHGINEVQVESGATLCGAFLDAGLVDELLLYVAPKLLGADARALVYGENPATLAAAPELEWIDVRHVGNDLRLLLRPKIAG